MTFYIEHNNLFLNNQPFFLDFQICSFHSSCFLVMLGFHFLALWCTTYGYGGYGVLGWFTFSNWLIISWPSVPHVCNEIGRVLGMQTFTLQLQLLMHASRCVIINLFPRVYLKLSKKYIVAVSFLDAIIFYPFGEGCAQVFVK